VSEVSSLAHEVRNNTMESRSYIEIRHHIIYHMSNTESSVECVCVCVCTVPL
jgi:hypothetical protein